MQCARMCAAERWLQTYINVLRMLLLLLQVQGVLMSAAERWPHIHISDSLVMADTAVGMAEAGCK